MKKVVIIIISFIFLFINNKNILSNEKNSKNLRQESKQENIETKKHEFYVANVPKINQDYTISYYDGYEKTSNNLVEDETMFESEKSISKEENNMIISDVINEEDITDEKEELAIDEIKVEDILEIDENKDDNLNNSSSEQISNDEVSKETIEEIKENNVNVKNGFYEEDGNTYYYENNNKVTGIKNINGVNHYFSPIGKYLGTNNIKVVDVSYYQRDINWNTFLNESDCYGVILRLGYYETLDKKFERNLNELKRLNIPYGIYLFSYSSTLNGAKKEADFTNKMISKYDINPSLGIYYDIESWSTKSSNSNNITKNMYDKIIQHYINSVSNYTNYKYKVKVYSGRWYAMNRLGSISKKYVDWVAEYNKTCKYDDYYSMWQYTSKGRIPGINGNVDISYIL